MLGQGVTDRTVYSGNTDDEVCEEYSLTLCESTHALFLDFKIGTAGWPLILSSESYVQMANGYQWPHMPKHNVWHDLNVLPSKGNFERTRKGLRCMSSLQIGWLS